MTAIIRGTGAPGVYPLINTGQSLRSALPRTSDQAFCVGKSVWGKPNTPITVTRGNLTAQLGPAAPGATLREFAEAFFNNYGTRLIVCRVVDNAAAVSTLSLSDRATTPLSTLRIDSKFPSATADVLVTIEDGTETGTFKLTERSVKLGIPRKSYDNIKLTFTTDEAAAIAAGTSKFTTIQQINLVSALLNLTSLASGTVAPGNIPALTAETALSGGNDGFSGVNDATHIGANSGGVRTGLHVFDTEDLGRGQVAMYGVTTQAARNALFQHCEDYKRFAVPDLAFALSPDDAIAVRAQHDTSYGAFYYPTDIQIEDYNGSGLPKLMYPSPFVCGIFAEAERLEGISRAPANYKIPDALNVGTLLPTGMQVDDALQATLAAKQINAIRILPERGIVVYDEWVIKAFGRVLAVHEQRVLNQIYYDLKLTYSDAIFGQIDPALQRAIESVTNQYLEGLGSRVLEEFSVRCDDTNNSELTRAAQQLNVDIGLRIVGAARMIFVRIDSSLSSIGFNVLDRAA